MKTMASEKEKRIIRGCIKGRKRDQRTLYELYAPLLLPVCMRYTDGRVGAEDVLQEAFVKIFDNLESYRGQGSFAGWLRRIVVNTALNMHRNKRVNQTRKDISEYAELLPGERDADSELVAEDILKAIQMLSPEFRNVFNMYDIDGYTHKEIAKELKITETACRSRLKKARQLLREWLSDYENRNS